MGSIFYAVVPLKKMVKSERPTHVNKKHQLLKVMMAILVPAREIETKF